MNGETVVHVTVDTTSERSVTVARTDDLNVTVAQPGPVNSVSASTEVVSVQELGIVGPTGPTGPTGPSGAAPLSYAVNAVSSWYQTHSFEYPPEVRLVDEENEVVEIGVEYPAPDAVSITFPVPFTGTIYLS